MKIKPFLTRRWRIVFIATVIMVQPYWVVEIYANFTFFHNINDVFLKTRPYEALCRDPWWILTTVLLFYYIKSRYELSLWEIIRISPRFGVMLAAMLLSIAFIILDILSVIGALKSSLPTGINPFWKLSFVFKCLTDSVILDDFKTALDRLRAFKISRMGSFSVDNVDRRSRKDGRLESAWDAASKKPPHASPPMPSPDGDYIQQQPPYFKPENTAIYGAADKRDSPQHLEQVNIRQPSRDRDEQEMGPTDTEKTRKEYKRRTDTLHPATAASNDEWPLQRRQWYDSDDDDSFREQRASAEAEYANAVRHVTGEHQNIS
jgi:hypothetical protein